jgi:uncharacterized protein (DUF58 family)
VAFLDPTVITQLDTLSVRARLIVQGALTGMHRARLHGSSIEFAEHKEYSPGDEIKHIDWKAYAKLDRYYVKQFEQESQLTVYLVLDASGSMDYAGDGVSKLSWAAHLLAALAYLLIRQRDKVGLCVFGDTRVDTYIPPRARSTHLSDLLSVIDDVTGRGARGDEPASAALARLGELTRRKRALILVASDLFEPGDEALATLRRLQAQGHDVALFHVLDPHEIDLPFDGLTVFEGLEDDRELLVNPAAVRAQYQARMTAFLDETRDACTAAGVEYHQVTTADPLEQRLLDFLTLRSRMIAPRRWTS